jgi:hypothetical protein
LRISEEETPCIFPFVTAGHVIPFCSKTSYYSEGFGWCGIAVEEDGITCAHGCEEQGVTWEACNPCTVTDSGPHEGVPSCEPDARTTMEGEPCVFPFVYKGRAYADCTMDFYDTWVDGVYPPTRPWCGLDAEAFVIDECAPCGDFEVSTSKLEGDIHSDSIFPWCACVPSFHIWHGLFLSAVRSFVSLSFVLYWLTIRSRIHKPNLNPNPISKPNP